MKYASDFRSIARGALSGKWGPAVVAGLVASLLGGIDTAGIEFNFGDTDTKFSFDLDSIKELATPNWTGLIPGILLGGAAFVIVFALAFAVAFFFIGSIVRIGYSQFNLDLVDRQKLPEINTLFGYFRHWKTAAATAFLQGLYIILWMLLFIIPGIIAAYSYAMTGYILAKHPELTASEAIARSKQIMEGNRFRLFCLQFSFIGWDLLCVLTLGIGNLWLTPYKQAATAAFYREISGTEQVITIDAPSPAVDVQ